MNRILKRWNMLRNFKEKRFTSKKSKIREAIWLGYVTFAEILIECEQ